MPRDLFDAVAFRPPSVRSRRAPILSVIAHAIGIAFAVAASLAGSDILPRPQEGLAYFEPTFQIAEIPVPPEPPRRKIDTLAPPSPERQINPAAAPTVAPEEIRPETGVEHEVVSRQEGVIVGIANGTALSALEGAPPSPPPPPPGSAEPIRLHSGIRAPVKVSHVAPVYPPIALASRIEGLVILEATIDTDGTVTAAKVLKSVPTLDQAAIDAVRQWRFTPTLLNGVPVAVIMTVTVNFKLQ